MKSSVSIVSGYNIHSVSCFMMVLSHAYSFYTEPHGSLLEILLLLYSYVINIITRATIAICMHG